MYVNVAVLKETQPRERRVALVPSVVPKLTKLGAKLHMQTGASDAIGLIEAGYTNGMFIEDCKQRARDTDAVPVAQRASRDVVEEMKKGERR